MMTSSQLQSLIAINAKHIDAANIFYQSYKDILKDFRECGKSDDEAYSRYSKAAKKELARLHLLEKNQRALLAELRTAYYHENMIALTEIYGEESEGCYA